MKFNAPPERIWLQLHGDCEPEYPVECGEETTWCWESIFSQDIEYVLADLANQMVKAERERCAKIVEEKVRLIDGLPAILAIRKL